jgi:hypothetical protein
LKHINPSYYFLSLGLKLIDIYHSKQQVQKNMSILLLNGKFFSAPLKAEKLLEQVELSKKSTNTIGVKSNPLIAL